MDLLMETVLHIDPDSLEPEAYAEAQARTAYIVEFWEERIARGVAKGIGYALGKKPKAGKG